MCVDPLGSVARADRVESSFAERGRAVGAVGTGGAQESVPHCARSRLLPGLPSPWIPWHLVLVRTSPGAGDRRTRWDPAGMDIGSVPSARSGTIGRSESQFDQRFSDIWAGPVLLKIRLPRADGAGRIPVTRSGPVLDSCGRVRGVAQLGSAPALGAGGRRFKSCHPDKCSFLAACGGSALRSATGTAVFRRSPRSAGRHGEVRCPHPAPVVPRVARRPDRSIRTRPG